MNISAKTMCLAGLFFALLNPASPYLMAQTTAMSLDPQLEQQAREIGRSLRCVVCQNQSIEDSDALLAADMRELVRARLLAGDEREQIIALMRERYGDYVLLSPPLQPHTYLLWLLPFICLSVAALWWALALRHKPEPEMNDVDLDGGGA